MDLVSIVDEISDSLSHRIPALRVTCVGTDRRVVVLSEVCDPVKRVLAEYTHFSEGLIHHTTKDFTVECDDALANFLRVADIQSSRLLELVLGSTSFRNLFVDFLALDGDRSAHGVLGLDDILAKTVKYRLVMAARQTLVK